MTQRFRIFFMTLILLPIMAQANPNFQQGDRYLQLEVIASPVVSMGYFLQNNFALTGGVTLALNGDIDVNGFGLQIGFDRYQNGNRVAPFVGGRIMFDINPVAYGSAGWRGSRISFLGHLGINYFVAEQISLSGRAGLLVQANSPKNRSDSLNLMSFTSGVEIKIFF